MGVCQSSEVQIQTQISKKIDRDLRATPEKLTQKLLLLGKLAILHKGFWA